MVEIKVQDFDPARERMEGGGGGTTQFVVWAKLSFMHVIISITPD